MSSRNAEHHPPPRALIILYFAPAHVALALAFAALAIHPQQFAGFFYQSRMIASVHLVTLGWITASILGALYLVAPIALRTSLQTGWPDYAAAVLVWTGIIGMVAHFWIAEYGGMAWSGATVAAGVLWVAVRLARPLAHARVPLAIRLHLGLACLSFASAATMGVLLGINKTHAVLSGSPLAALYGHAHLAAVGWASAIVVGVGYRLLPMVLPARMPSGATLYVSALLLQSGAWGLFVTRLLQGRTTWPFAVAIVGGFAVFLADVVWMFRHQLPRPPAIRTPDPAVLHAAAALLSLTGACMIGLRLTTTEMSEPTLRLAMIYGVLGLVGFLAQMVVAMKGRLLPLFAWYWAFANAGQRGPVPSPHDMPWRPAQYLVVALWWLGVPALAAGLAFGLVALVTTAAGALLAATILDSAQAVTILRHAFVRPPLDGRTS